jgi:hypothetical protein
MTKNYKFAYNSDGAKVAINRSQSVVLNVVFWRHPNHPRTYTTAKRTVTKKWGKTTEEGLFDFRACEELVRKGLASVVRQERGRHSASLTIEINKGVRYEAVSRQN